MAWFSGLLGFPLAWYAVGAGWFPLMEVEKMAYMVVRVAPWSEWACKGKSGKVSAAGIRAALNVSRSTLEFVDVLSGRPLTALEAMAAGYDTLNVRFNADRSVAVVKL